MTLNAEYLPEISQSLDSVSQRRVIRQHAACVEQLDRIASGTKPSAATLVDLVRLHEDCGLTQEISYMRRVEGFQSACAQSICARDEIEELCAVNGWEASEVTFAEQEPNVFDDLASLNQEWIRRVWQLLERLKPFRFIARPNEQTERLLELADYRRALIRLLMNCYEIPYSPQADNTAESLFWLVIEMAKDKRAPLAGFSLSNPGHHEQRWQGRPGFKRFAEIQLARTGFSLDAYLNQSTFNSQGDFEPIPVRFSEDDCLRQIPSDVSEDDKETRFENDKRGYAKAKQAATRDWQEGIYSDLPFENYVHNLIRDLRIDPLRFNQVELETALRNDYVFTTLSVNRTSSTKPHDNAQMSWKRVVELLCG